MGLQHFKEPVVELHDQLIHKLKHQVTQMSEYISSRELTLQTQQQTVTQIQKKLTKYVIETADVVQRMSAERQAACVYSTRAALRDHGHKVDHALLKWDYKNAFNMVDRSAIIGVVREVLPELSAWVEFCYARFSDLFWGEHTISSECGVQQGDPLGPLLFSLVLQKVVSFLATQDLLLNAWFLDDGTIIGERAALSVLYEQISLMSSELGLVVGDCELFWPSGDPSFPLFHPSIKRANDTGVSILGAPVGSDDFAVRYIMSRVEKVKLIHSKLACLDDGNPLPMRQVVKHQP